EYAGNIFWIVGFSLIASWIVAVVFTPYLGVKLLPDIKIVKGGHAGIYSTSGYQRLRHFITWCVRKKYTVDGIVVGAFLMAEARDHLKLRLRQAAADGLAPEARIRATPLVFGPPSPFPVAFRVMGPDPEKLRDIAHRVEEIMRNDPNMRTVNVDWGERVPKL